jgi:hypothetical protein
MMGLGPIGVVLFLLLAALGLARLVSPLRRVRRDAAQAVLMVGVRALSPERAGWGRAMLAELDHIEGRLARLSFALGCVRAALTHPPLLALVVAAPSLALGGLVGVQLTGPDLGITSRIWLVATVVEFALFAGAALVLAIDGGPHRGATRRLGVACGVTVGALFYVRPVLEQLYPGGGAVGGGGIFAGGPLVLVPVALGFASGWTGRSGSATVRTAAWAALVSGIVWMSGIILASVTSVQSLNDRAENAFLWFVFPLVAAGNGFVVGLVAAALGVAARPVLRLARELAVPARLP